MVFDSKKDCWDCNRLEADCECDKFLDRLRAEEDANDEREVAYFNAFVPKTFRAICRNCGKLCPMTEYMHPTTPPPTHGICDVCCEALIP